MRLQELFAPGDILVGFEAADKWEALTRLLDHLLGDHVTLLHGNTMHAGKSER